jgi:hypothetical protein
MPDQPSDYEAGWPVPPTPRTTHPDPPLTLMKENTVPIDPDTPDTGPYPANPLVRNSWKEPRRG